MGLLVWGVLVWEFENQSETGKEGCLALSTRQTGNWGQMQRRPPHPSGPAPTQPILHKDTHKGPFSPGFPCSHRGNPGTSSESGQTTSQVWPKGAWKRGGDVGHPLLLRGSALEDCGLRSAENLARFLGAGTRSGEVWVWVGCPGLVIFLCIIYVRFIILWNLSDPPFSLQQVRDQQRRPL